MAAEKAPKDIGGAQQAPDEGRRDRSTIQFPYLALDEAMAIAKGVHVIGGGTCQVDQLAAHLQQPASSGMFRLRLNTARIFGLITHAQGTVMLTALGIRICDPQQEQAARAEAFLTVPLYKQVHDQFKGSNLPPLAGLESAMVNMGVAPKQKSNARQVFQRAAAQAGFFAYGPSRLVYPTIKGSGGAPATGSEPPLAGMADQPAPVGRTSRGGGGEGGGGEEQHPFIQGLIKTLPPPETSWPIEKRAKWLQAASHVFDLIYAEDTTGTHIDIKVQKETVQ